MGLKKRKFGEEVRIFNDELNCKYLIVDIIVKAICLCVTEAFL